MEALRLLEGPIEEEKQKLREVAFFSKKGEAGRFFFDFLWVRGLRVAEEEEKQ